MTTAVKDEWRSVRSVRTLRIANTLLLLSLVLVFTFAVVLYRRNVNLGAEQARLTSNLNQVSGMMAGSPSAQVGDVLPSFEATGANGQRLGISYNGKSKYLLYIFSPRCEVCIRELPTWKTLTTRAKAKNIRVVALEVVQSRATGKKITDADFESTIFPSIGVQRAYRVMAVPTTMLVSNQGVIEWVLSGALDSQATTELLSAIDR